MASSDRLYNERIVRIPKLDYVPDSKGLGCAYFTHMLKYKDKIAQIDATTGKKETFFTLLQRCIRTAITMRSKGITENDLVATCTYNELNSCVPYIATLFLGAKIASLDPTISLKDTVHLLQQTSPKLIFVMPEAVELIENAVEDVKFTTEIIVLGNTKQHTPFEEFLQQKDEESDFTPFEIKNIHETAIITFSSGTSGLPKGICLNHSAFLNQIQNTISCGFFLDIILVSTSLYWITASLFLGVSIMFGKTRLVIPKFDVHAVWEAIDKYQPTYMFSAPPQILALYKHNQNHGKCSLKHVTVGGGPILKEQIEAVRKAFPETQVIIAYGQTEVAGFLTTFKPCNPKEIEYIRTKPSSCGTGIPGISYKIVDPETEELLGPNTPGEIRLKTENQLNGYYKMVSSDAWDSEGWIITGDIGYYDEDRCFYIVDRIKEMLKFQSWHVPPAVLEDIIVTHPAIASAVVIGIPHEIDGDHPMAVVVLKKASKGVTAESIEKFVEERVPDRQRLRGGVKIVNHIPVTPSGKIKRRDVRDMLLQKRI